MCGIVGYAGKRQAAPILLEGLAKLEYRGYDSAGLCTVSEGSFAVEKVKGRLSALVELTKNGETMPGVVGIGHTRWATHGEPSETNSHPHVSTNGHISVVHNGIIENYLSLRDYLTARGKSFRSETDTEVAANLIEFYYEQTGELKEAVRLAEARMTGSYALSVLCADDPDRILAVKKDSPLVFGFGQGENFIASDVPAILKYTRKVVYLDDGDMVVFRTGDARFYNAMGREIEKEPEIITWEMADAEKGGYAHFMRKEIQEQPKALRDTIGPRVRNGRVVLEELPPEALAGVKRIYITACGSAYYVGCLGKYILEKTCRIPTEAALASEFRYADPVLGPETLVIVISQSGETADTLAALREANARGARTLAIVNVVGSAISKTAQHVLYTWAGPEIAVATTKAYSTQLGVIYLLSLYLGDLLGTLPPEAYTEMLRALAALPEQMESLLTPQWVERLRALAGEYCKKEDVFFLGRNLDSASCLEGSLKLKEIAYIHSEAYAAGELKHGPISLVEKGTLVIALATVGALFEKTASNMKEVKARGGTVLAITTDDREEEICKLADRYLLIPRTHPMLQPSLTVLPMQLFAYFVALARGCDVDKPRNLAKSVTVE